MKRKHDGASCKLLLLLYSLGPFFRFSLLSSLFIVFLFSFLLLLKIIFIPLLFTFCAFLFGSISRGLVVILFPYLRRYARLLTIFLALEFLYY